MPRGGKNDAKPRGRMTAYAYFVQTCREEHKKKHPDENVVFLEFSRKCAERWQVRDYRWRGVGEVWRRVKIRWKSVGGKESAA